MLHPLSMQSSHGRLQKESAMMLNRQGGATYLVADIHIQRLASGEYTRKHLPTKALQHLLPATVLQRQHR